MGRDLRLFLLAVGLPALVVAGAGICLVRYEMQRERARQEERMRERAEAGAARRAANAARREEWSSRHRGHRPRHEQRTHEHTRRDFLPRFFSPEESLATTRIYGIGGCLFALLVLSFGVGGWMLVRDARRAREEALKKTDFLSNVSHEFKTPLTTICLCAELAQDEGLSPERRTKALSSILAEANRLKGLVLNALDFSRLEKNRRAFNPAPCDLAALVREAAEPLLPRFAENGISLPGADAPVPATADAGAFKQILVSLLDNAAKYAASGGPVEVSFADSKPGRVRLEVADRGPGLDSNGLKHAFDRFWRGDDATTAETGGSGLGLAIARGLARGMGGDLSVANRDGGGLVFTLSLK